MDIVVNRKHIRPRRVRVISQLEFGVICLVATSLPVWAEGNTAVAESASGVPATHIEGKSNVNARPLKTPSSKVSAHELTQSHKADLHHTLRKAVEESGTTPKQEEDATRTANAVNKLPGEKIDPKDLEHPPITGFHPLKKIFQPISDLEKTTEKLNVEGTKLEKPMGQLAEPMVHLQKKMVSVDAKVIQMQKTLHSVSDEVTGARSDLSSIREEMNDLKGPIVALQKPVTGVANPLEQIQLKLNLLLLFIFIFGMIVAFGTPIAAIMIYRKRHQLFPSAKKAPAGATH